MWAETGMSTISSGLRALVWLAALPALAACANPHAPSASATGEPAAAQASTGGRSCFNVSQINGWRAGDRGVVYVRVGVNRVFRMQLLGPCPDVNWTERIAIEAGPTSWICSGLNATIIAPSRIGPRRCPVTDLRELTPAEIAALPPRHRP
jgi:hypothetical protein